VAVTFVFVDGLGAGERDPASNPLARRDFLLSRFSDGSGTPLPREGRVVLADATLGVAGRPQSATGQTTLFTGENAPAQLGRHLLGFPNATLRDLLARRSLFKDLSAAGRRGAFANAFPVAYLRALELPCEGEAEFEIPRRRARMSASTCAFAAGQGRFRTWADAREGQALPHDLTARRANGYGARLPERDVAAQADALSALSREHDLTLFEFFETDEAGHAMSMELALAALERLDSFLRRLLVGLPRDHSLVVTSDHGNVEDLSSRNHTRARVPLLAFGPAAEHLDRVRDLTGVKGLLLEAAGCGPPAR
jgi:hypothetical protein